MIVPDLGVRGFITHLIPGWLKPLYRVYSWLAVGITLVFVLIGLGNVLVGNATLSVGTFWRFIGAARILGLHLAAGFVFPTAPLLVVYGLYSANRSGPDRPPSDDRTEVTDTGIVRRRNENDYIIHPGRRERRQTGYRRNADG